MTGIGTRQSICNAANDILLALVHGAGLVWILEGHHGFTEALRLQSAQPPSWAIPFVPATALLTR